MLCMSEPILPGRQTPADQVRAAVTRIAVDCARVPERTALFFPAGAQAKPQGLCPDPNHLDFAEFAITTFEITSLRSQ